MLVPIQLKPDRKARAPLPRGWYLFDTEKCQTIRLDLRFDKKRDCQAECDRRNAG